MKSIFFNADDDEFCKRNLLLAVDSIVKDDRTIGTRIVFLHTRNNEFNDSKFKIYAEEKEYLKYKNILVDTRQDEFYFYENEKAIKHLKCVDTKDKIRVYKKIKKTKKRNNSFSVKEYNEYKFFAGFDTEYISNITYNARLNQIEDLEIEKINILKNDDKILSYQLSLQINDELFLNTVIFPYMTGVQLHYNDVIKDTLVNNLYLITNNYKKYHDKFNVFLIAHKNLVDFSKINDFVTLDIIKNNKSKLPKRMDGLKSIRNCFSTVKPFVLGDYNNRNFKAVGNIHLRDSLLLDNPQSLRKLGDSLNFKKVEIGDNIEQMENFKNENINAFLIYAMQDSCIVVNFLYNLYKHYLDDGKSVPLTIGGAGATFTRNILKKIYNLSDEEFDKVFRGLNTYKTKGKGKTLEYNDMLDDIFHSFSRHYYGGRNQTFIHGRLRGNFYDIDGSKFYPVMASIIPLIDFNKIIHLPAGEVKEDSFDWKNEEVGYAYINFEFTAPQKYLTCITQATKQGNENYGLIYTRKGKNVFTTLSEIKSAYKLGCKITILNGMKFGTVDIADDKKYPLALLFKELAEERNKYPKGTAGNKFWKLVMNSITGKFGQGLRHKRVYDYNSTEMDEIPHSRITSAPYVIEITSLARTIITECMNIFISEGYKVINVVTDGFMVQTPENKKITDEEINNIIKKHINDDMFPSLYKWSKALDKLGEKNFLELKHCGTELLSVKTRVTALLNLENENMSQFSCTGYITPPEWSNYTLNEKIKAFIQVVISRKERIKIKGKKLVNARDLRNGSGTSARMVDKQISFNFDFKSKVVKQREENNYITYITTSWEDVEEFRKEKRYREKNKDIQIIDSIGDLKMSLLEELRTYKFRNIDKKNEYKDLVEKFLIMVSKTKLFYLIGINKELDYTVVKGLLSIKDIDLKIDKRAFGKLKLQKIVKDNLDNLKNTLLRQMNDIFSEENIKFGLLNTENNNLKYLNVFFEEENKKVEKKKEKLKEKIEIHIAEEELKEIKFKS